VIAIDFLQNSSSIQIKTPFGEMSISLDKDVFFKRLKKMYNSWEVGMVSVCLLLSSLFDIFTVAV